MTKIKPLNITNYMEVFEATGNIRRFIILDVALRIERISIKAEIYLDRLTGDKDKLDAAQVEALLDDRLTAALESAENSLMKAFQYICKHKKRSEPDPGIIADIRPELHAAISAAAWLTSYTHNYETGRTEHGNHIHTRFIKAYPEDNG